MSRALGIAALASLAVVAAAVLAPAAAGAGWRAAFLLVSAPPVGAVALLMIARLTGANWDAALKPLLPGLVLLPVAAIGVVIDQILLRPAPPHLAIYLGPLAFTARTAVAVALWCGLGLALARRGLTPLQAGLGLVGHGIAVSVIAIDWILGVEPGQPGSALGMALGVAQILAATGLACLLGLGVERARKDLSRLAVAAALGLSYLLYVDYLIVWFGELPTRVDWYVARSTAFWGPWPVLAVALGLFGLIVCVGLIRTGAALRAAGFCALSGVALAFGWLVLPPTGAVSALPALAAAALMAAAWAIAARRLGDG